MIFASEGDEELSALSTLASRSLLSPHLRASGLYSTGGGLLFILGAALMLDYSVSVMKTWQSAKNWVEAPARLIKLTESDKPANGRPRSYDIICVYSYEFEGATYFGSRIGLNDLARIYSLDLQAQADRLRDAWNTHSKVTCFVDPAEPRRALLDRDLDPFRVMSLACLVCGLVSPGVFLLGRGFRKWRYAGRVAILEQTHPGEPWMWQPEWAARSVAASTGRQAWRACTMAAFWLFVAGPIGTLVIFDKGGSLQLCRTILLAAGLPVTVALLAWTAYCVRLHLRFGRSRFEIVTLPGVVGGELRGNLVLRGDLANVLEVEVVLKAVRVIRAGIPMHRYTKTAALWSDAAEFDSLATVNENQLILPVEFYIPAECSPTSATNSKNRIEWKLEAHLAMHRRKPSFDFSVPVFQMETESARI